MRGFLDAATDRVEAGGVDRLYPENGVPQNPPKPYQTIAVTPDRADAYTLDATHGMRLYRIVLRSVSSSQAGALDVDALATDALLDQRLEVAGYDCGPCRLELGSAIMRDPDDGGVLTVTTTLTFTATKEQ